LNLPPPIKAVVRLVEQFSVDEIKTALTKHMKEVSASEVKMEMRRFFVSGGAESVISALRPVSSYRSGDLR
jgi:hypothetical protein